MSLHPVKNSPHPKKGISIDFQSTKEFVAHLQTEVLNLKKFSFETMIDTKAKQNNFLFLNLQKMFYNLSKLKFSKTFYIKNIGRRESKVVGDVGHSFFLCAQLHI